MIWDSRVEVHIYNQPTDMRKSHDGLAALCQQAMGCNPLSGQVFVFMNKRRDRVKSLFWDGTGSFIHVATCIQSEVLPMGSNLAFAWQTLLANIIWTL